MAKRHRVFVQGCVIALSTVVVGGCTGSGGGDVAPPRVDPPVDPVPPMPRTTSPAVSGGSLLVMRDGKTALAADPDRDALWVVDLVALQGRSRIDLLSGDEPGRAAEDGAGRVHVALRRGGALLTVDPATGATLARRAVCAAPRGVAYDAAADALHVACAGGELVTLPAAGGAATRTLKIDGDLRDVVVSGSNLLVTRFRSAELLTVGADGTIVSRSRPKPIAISDVANGPAGDPPPRTGMVLAEAAVAWRMQALLDGSIMLLHERASTGMIDTRRPGGYGGGGCKGAGIVSGALTHMGPSGEVASGPTLPFVGYAVDAAVSRDGKQIAVVTPSLGTPGRTPGSSVMLLSPGDLHPPNPCSVFPAAMPTPVQPGGFEAIAVAFDGSGRVVVQARQPAGLMVGSSFVAFDRAEDVSNSGHRLFHTATAGASIACAACHPEAGDDGRVWNFAPIGPRRTQSLRGGILATAPFHWDGDMTDMKKLMRDVFTGRMSGENLSDAQMTAVASWLDAQPVVPRSLTRDAQAVARGKSLFEDATVACASCHSGDHLTNNQSVSVGTGGSFQVPSLLGIASRAPFMHTGCAPTLTDRFGGAPECGGGDSHGKTSHLSSAQLGDLVAYLETL